MTKPFSMSKFSLAALLLSVTLSAGASGAPSQDPPSQDPPAAKPIRMIPGKIRVTRVWFTNNGGSISYEHDVPCRLSIQIPVYDIRDPEHQIPYAAPAQECKTTNHDGTPATVYTNATVVYVRQQDDSGKPVDRKSFSAVFNVNSSPGKGSSADFSTTELGLRNMMLNMGNPNVDWGGSDTYFNVAVEAEDQP